MKLKHLEETKKLFPHWLDKNPDSNFTKHLTVINNQQLDLYHKLKCIDWSRTLEKPLQIWKTQTEPYNYTMNFKVLMPNLKEVNIYKNPILNNDDEVTYYEEKITETYNTDKRSYFEDSLNYTTPTYKMKVKKSDGSIVEKVGQKAIPSDTFVLEVITYDDYRFVKGFPENDYTSRDENILDYHQYNESFLDISLETISYTDFLVFRTHKDNVKTIEIRKNYETIYYESFEVDTENKYFDKHFSLKNENPVYQEGSYDIVPENDVKITKVYNEDTENEYIYRYPLSSEDFDEETGELKDKYDLVVTIFEKRYKCKNNENNRIYTKRYNGYSKTLGDCFDHDYSLDIIGHLFNIHRYRFYQVYKKNNYYYSKTYPTFNNRSTEDDYHYMKRIQRYIKEYNHTPFPVLEFWKYYYANSVLVNRKDLIGRQDHTYLRTNYYNCDYIGEDLVEEEFDDIRTINEYSDTETTYTNISGSVVSNIVNYTTNKATTIEGKAVIIDKYDEPYWYEAVIVNPVYVAPLSNYRLRYGVKDNDEFVSIRLYYYNRNGIRIKSLTLNPLDNAFEDDNSIYPVSEGYEYSDVLIQTPDDAVSIEIVLESKTGFAFKDVTFQRQTIASADNLYMDTDLYYNSCTYDLYANYYDIPTNLRIGDTERFNRLFNRSLPLTRRGVFNVTVDEDADCNVNIDTDYVFKLDNIVPSEYTEGYNNTEYIIDLTDYIAPNCTYRVSFYNIQEKHWSDTDEISDLVKPTPSYLIHSFVELYDDKDLDNANYIMAVGSDLDVDSDITDRVSFTFETTDGVYGARLILKSSNEFNYWGLKISRDEELTNEELTRGH